jgi:iron complex outermembrane recepter protein
MKNAASDQEFGRQLQWVFVLVALVCISFSLPALAGEGAEKATPSAQKTDESTSDVFKLGTMWTVIVTDEERSSAEKIESSIDEKKIELFEDKDVGAALSRMPGLRYVRPTGGRYESGVYLRGFTAFGNRDAQVPIYMDGIPVSVPYDYSMDMGRFTTGDISTIQVAKGYGSALYGPNILGGVINIVSRRPTKPLDGKFTLGFGTGNSGEANGAFGTLQDKWYAQVGLSYYERQFVNAATDFVDTDDSKTPQARATDRMNYRTRDKKASFRFAFIPNATDEYVFSYSTQSGQKGPRNGAPGYQITAWEWPNWDRQTVSFISTTRLGKFYVKPRIYYDKYYNALYGWGGNDYTSIYDDNAWGGGVEMGTTHFENNVLRGVFSYKKDHHTAYNKDGRDGGIQAGSNQLLEQQLFSFALEDTYKVNPQWEIQAGLNYSKRDTMHVDLGSNLVGLLSAFPSVSAVLYPTIDTWDPEVVFIYKPVNHHSIHYSIAKKTRYPSMRNQYSNYGSGSTVKNPSTGTQVPLVTLQNPDLLPERVIHQEIGYELGSCLRSLQFRRVFSTAATET